MTDQDYRERLAYRAAELAEAMRDVIEAELGPVEVAVDADARCVISNHDGWQFEARLSDPHADARLIIEEVDA